jgi:histidine kinase/DNA gyrase B/HSP90-like ATPase
MPKTTKKKGKATTNEIEVFPAKSFFVDMLTRDIDLADAILDLLDNCVDGFRRLQRLANSAAPNAEKPYLGFWARVCYEAGKFTIEDNCGGIPLDAAIHYAFRFGKPADFAGSTDGTIGLVGIGMKRAILKMGRSCLIHSHHQADTFEVRITPSWLKRDNDWHLRYTRTKPKLEQHGTRIEVTDLSESVQKEFRSELFKKKLWEKVEGAFSLLIARGFKVEINEREVRSEMPTLLWQDEIDPDGRGIRPYVYHHVVDGVEVYLAIGFREPEEQRGDDDDMQRYYKSKPAGWTVACNDRVVLYRDKSEQTGWGTDAVPEYHTQFIGISGFAEFRADDPRDLPFTTTKHGVDRQSKVFIRVFDKMREATKVFTDWTYKFKDYASQSKDVFKSAKSRSVEDIRALSGATARGKQKSKTGPLVSLAKLPKPKVERLERTISFRKPEPEIRKVSRSLFGNPDAPASRVGEECFDRVLREADA